MVGLNSLEWVQNYFSVEKEASDGQGEEGETTTQQ